MTLTDTEFMPPDDGIFTFDGEYAFLSNFYPAEFVWDNWLWKTSEHAYQAAKSLDITAREWIRDLASPSQTKRAGKSIVIRPDWEQVKVRTMYDIVYAKFLQNPNLAAKLIQTGDLHLEEGNTWKDRFWGVCPPRSGNGRNELGKILMIVRHHLAH